MIDWLHKLALLVHLFNGAGDYLTGSREVEQLCSLSTIAQSHNRGGLTVAGGWL